MTRSALPYLLVLLLLPTGLHGQIPQGVEGPFRPMAEANAAIQQLKSPYCPGFMLEVCTSSQAEMLRDTIQTMAMDGRTSDELVAWMLDRYGEEYLAVPRSQGAGLWAWAAPPAALALGVVAVVVALRRLLRPEEEADPQGERDGAAASEPPVPAGPLTDEDRALVEEALRELDRAEDPDF